MIDLPQHFGKYTLVERIAIGGMAEIFKASAEGLGGFEKLLAIKRLHPRYSEDQDFIHMLVDEAKIAVQLSHSNLGQIFDLGREDELVYIAMEYIDGRDLYRVLRRLNEHGHMMPIEVAVYIIMEVCGGLDYAHRKTTSDGTPLSIIHRDISPQNVIVSWEGEVKLIDFGIAKAAMRAFETESGVIKGKFYYMSPEQARGDSLDHRSDIFSLGICLYELLTGHTVYREEDDVTLLSRVRRAEISPPTTMRPEIPHDLERIVMKSLARNPKRRYQSAHQLQMALSSFLYSLGQPFNKVQLGAYIRDIFEREQAHENVPISYHDRFMSRVDYNVDGSSLASELMGEDEVTAIVGEKQRDTLQPDIIPTDAIVGEALISHDPYAEGVLSVDDDFEAEPTRAGGPPGLIDDFGDDEVTWLFSGAIEIEPATGEQERPPPVPPGPSIKGPGTSQSVSVANNATMPLGSEQHQPDLKPRVANKPKPIMVLDFDPDVHTGIVTGVYNEPTRITELDQEELLVSAGERPPTVRSESVNLYEVPLAFKLLFAIGLVVILLVGGAISALSAVLINRAGEPDPPVVVTGPLASNDPEPEATSPGSGEAPDAALAPVVDDIPDTRALVITVTGPDKATVKLGDLINRESPAAFDKLVVGQTYDLKVTADNHTPHNERLKVDEQMPSGYAVVLKPRLGTLTINTEPPGATIQIGERTLNEKTPHNQGDLNRASPFEVKLTLDGHEPHTLDVGWKDDEPDVKTLDIKLKAIEKASPPIADLGVSPPARARESRAQKRARERRERRDRIDRERRDRDRRERERLARERSRDRNRNSGSGGSKDPIDSNGFGTLAVGSKPWGQVYVDGKRVSNETPVTGLRLRAGYHTVKVVFPTLGNKARSKQVRISTNKNSVVSFRP